jgi:hypothetical protein
VPAVAAVGILGKTGMVLIADARLQADLVDRLGHRFGRRIGRKRLAVLVEEPRFGNLLGRQRLQLKRAFQEVVLDHRLVDLTHENGTIHAIRDGRVEVLGLLAERVVVDVPLGLFRTVGVVTEAAGQQEDRGKCQTG